MSAAALAFAFQQSVAFDEFIEVSTGRLSARPGQRLNLAVGDPPTDPNLNHDLNLAVIQAQRFKPLTVMPRHGDHKFASIVIKLRSTNARFGTQPNHIQRARSQLLDVPSVKQTFRQFCVSRVRSVFNGQLLDRQFRRQSSRIANFNVIGKDRNLHRSR